MNTFKTLCFDNTLHIGQFSAGKKMYGIYFFEISDISNTSIVLPEDITPKSHFICEVAFDTLDNQRNGTHFSRENVGFKAITVFRQVTDLIFHHFEEHHPGIYCFSATDKKLEIIYQRLLSILVRKHSGFSVQRALGDRDYVIRTPVSL